MKYIDPDKEEQAAMIVSLLSIAGAVVAFIVGYWVDEPGASGLAYIVGMGLLLVAWAAAWEVAGLDEEEF